VLGVLLTLAGCGTPGDPAAGRQLLPPVDPAAGTYAVSAPGPMRGGTVTPDLLVYGQDTLPDRIRARVATAAGVGRTATLAIGQVALAGRVLRIAAADPAALRRFTPAKVAATEDMWNRVAGGELALAADLRGTAETADGYLVLGQQPAAPRVHVAAYASLPPLVDVVLNPRWGAALGMREDNAMVLSVHPDTDPADVAVALRRRLPGDVAVQQLAPAAQGTGPQTAYLTGGSVAQAVGSFTYRPEPDGTVTVDPRWVSTHIATEEVPILGRVTCHRAMLPQLRAALTEVVRAGLADSIRPGEYGGCFHPRYIAHDPAQGLSLHSWGIAVDLNVPGNQRGTAGELDRNVVAIFKRWGFAWGGDWSYTDPMHFELAALVSGPVN
jgi:hypothetical protein